MRILVPDPGHAWSGFEWAIDPGLHGSFILPAQFETCRQWYGRNS